MKTYVLYHGNCMDGFGAAWAAWHHLRDSAEYIPVSYGDSLPKLNKNSKVYIIDFSFKKPIMEELIARHKQVVMLDHHKTAQEDLEGLPGVMFDMTKSGAMLSWEHFHPEESAPKLIQHIQDHDLWQFKLPDTKALMAYLQTEPKDFDDWSSIVLKLDNEQEAPYIFTQGKAILKYQSNQVDLICSQAKVVEEDGLKCVVVNATTNWSEVGSRLLELFSEADFSKSYYDSKEGFRKFSLRSRGNIDVSEIAKKYGGGGHKAASGYITKI